jgi:hypothetical protein
MSSPFDSLLKIIYSPEYTNWKGINEQAVKELIGSRYPCRRGQCS